MINKENYKALLDDFIEGRLSPELEEAFVLFLDEHPEFMPGELDATETKLDDAFKASLIKEPVLDEHSIDDFLIAELEGDISADDQQELDSFIQRNPQYQTDRELYGMTRLQADESIYMPNKDGLKKRPVFFLQTQVWWSAAAAVLVGLLFLFTLNRPTDIEGPITADLDQPVNASEQVKVTSPEEDLPVNDPVYTAEIQKDSDQPAKLAIAAAPGQGEPVQEPVSSARYTRDVPQGIAALPAFNSKAPRAEHVDALPVEMAALTAQVDPIQPKQSRGQTVLEWAYKRVRRTVTEEEILVPEEHIKEDVVEVLNSKVSPIFSITETPDGGSDYKIFGIHFHRAGR